MREVLERTRKSIEIERMSADERPMAMRNRFEGSTSISDEIAAYPERLEQQIKALGAEIAGDDLWIERVENATGSKFDLESTLSDDNAFGKLLKDILATPDNPNEIDGLKDVIADLRQKIPTSLNSPPSWSIMKSYIRPPSRRPSGCFSRRFSVFSASSAPGLNS